MDRAEELQAIEEHIATRGAYRAQPGESFYGDDEVPYRVRMHFNAQSLMRRKKGQRPTCQLPGCDRPIGKRAKKYCSPECQYKARMEARVTVRCGGCGVKIRRQKARAKGNNYCSNRCQNIARWRKNEDD